MKEETEEIIHRKESKTTLEGRNDNEERESVRNETKGEKPGEAEKREEEE